MTDTLKILFFISSIANSLYCQEIVATQGETLNNEKISLNFTIGEPLISTFSNTSIIKTEGFHQLFHTSLSTSIENSSTVLGSTFSLAPNPASDFINVGYNFISNEDINIKIYNASGICLKNIKTNGANEFTNHLKLSLNEYAEGLYFLSIYTNSGIMTKTFFKKN